MSENLNPSPSTEEAISLLDSVYADVFFSKLAEYGFPIQSEEAALGALETAAYLDLADDTVKSATVDPYVLANKELKETLKSAGIIDKQPETKAVIKQAAYNLAHDPSLYAAVLAVKTASINKGE